MLYKELRPQSFDEIVGQDQIVDMLQGMLEDGSLPQALLLHGPSGCGKTTLARILKTELECSQLDYHEVNSAQFRGIDMIRDIQSVAPLSPVSGTCKIWLIDEAHQLSRDAQHGFLKLLEDTPQHVYFFLATTDPQKLINTIRTRCTDVAVKGLDRDSMEQVLDGVDCEISQDVKDAIIEHADGSPRKALVLLDQVLAVDDEEGQLALIQSSTGQAEAIQLARLLLNPKSTWKQAAAKIREIEEEPESLRWLVLSYATTVLLKSGGKAAARAYLVIEAMRDNFYDSKKAGLSAACYEIFHGGE